MVTAGGLLSSSTTKDIYEKICDIECDERIFELDGFGYRGC